MDKLLASVKLLVAALQDVLANIYHDPLDNPATLPMNLPPQPDRYTLWALAIQAEESSKPPRPTDINVRLKNPGNLKYTKYAASLGGLRSTVPGLDGGVFCEFPTYLVGLAALKQLLDDAVHDRLLSYKSTMSLKAFTKVFANPRNDSYCINVANKLKVTIDTPIKDIV